MIPFSDKIKDYECEKLVQLNERDSESLKVIFEDRNSAEHELTKVEAQIQNELYQTQNLLKNMNQIERDTLLSHQNQFNKVRRVSPKIFN